MEDLFDLLIPLFIIISVIASFFKKDSSDDENGNRGKEIEKKIGDFIADTFGAGGQKDTNSNPKAEDSQNNSSDEWIPAYEEKTGNDDRPLAKATDITKSKSELEDPDLKERTKKDNSTYMKLDDEITVRDGEKIYNKKNKKFRVEKKDAYQQQTGKKSKKILNGSSFDQDDLVKGVIFKEILDEPRAKKPYKPFGRL